MWGNHHYEVEPVLESKRGHQNGTPFLNALPFLWQGALVLIITNTLSLNVETGVAGTLTLFRACKIGVAVKRDPVISQP